MPGIFLLHTMHLFDEGTDWHLQNAGQSTLVLVLSGLIDMWGVPSFFVLSGTGVWFALKRRTGCKLLIERVRRLPIPVYRFAVTVRDQILPLLHSAFFNIIPPP